MHQGHAFRVAASVIGLGRLSSSLGPRHSECGFGIVDRDPGNLASVEPRNIQFVAHKAHLQHVGSGANGSGMGRVHGRRRQKADAGKHHEDNFHDHESLCATAALVSCDCVASMARPFTPCVAGTNSNLQYVVEAACGSSAAEVGRSRGKAKAVACSGVPDGTALDEGDGMESLVFMVRAYGDEEAYASDGRDHYVEMAEHLSGASDVEMARALGREEEAAQVH